MSRVLFLTNKFMDIYKDVIHELTIQGYDVKFLNDESLPNDPYLIRNECHKPEEYASRDLFYNNYWDEKISKGDDNWFYDYFFAIEGLSVSASLITKLRETNPRIKTILYLYDRTFSNYRFDILFKYYDSIYTFDLFDSKYYNINHLPIYWVPCVSAVESKYLLFGYATYQEKRYNIYKEVFNKVKQNRKPSFVKLYVSPYNGGYIKSFLRNITGKNIASKLNKEMIFDKIIPPEEFRNFISSSDIVLDTHNSFQDGLTARFMWALGAGKKIITTNQSVIHYSFYDPKFIHILGNDYYIPENFINETAVREDRVNEDIGKYRIDNWIKTMFK